MALLAGTPHPAAALDGEVLGDTDGDVGTDDGEMDGDDAVLFCVLVSPPTSDHTGVVFVAESLPGSQTGGSAPSAGCPAGC